MKILVPEFLVRWIINYAKRTPFFHLPGYMERYWLFKYRDWCPYSIRVHHIMRSDSDHHLHDHPWPYITVILRGGYWEITHGNKVKWYGPGRILKRAALHRHRLILFPDKDGETWTLFMMGRKCNDWGFYTPKGKVPWREYLPIGEANHQYYDTHKEQSSNE